jgi:hypothetical protein
MVKESTLDTANVSITLITITPVISKALHRFCRGANMEYVKNIVMIAINVGKRPLHGTKLLVMIAISRSLGESIILQPITPAALQPKPMHMEVRNL